MLLLDSELAVLAIRDQRVRNVAKRTLNCLLICEHHLLALRFRKPDSGLQPPSLKDGLRKGSRKVPEPCRSSEEVGQRRAFISGSPCQ